jgi:anaerobic magnesium-protoporphyrin IX monomethyl ester cyclase
MTEILLGQSYYLRFDPKLWEQMQPYPPLGTLYAASLLRQRGYEAALFDAMLAVSENEWALALDAHRPRFAVLYEDNFNYLSKMCLLRMREAALTMIGMARQRGCTVILCGADATDHAELYLRHGADFVLLGEGEATLVELLDRLTGRSNAAFDSILGLAFLDRERKAEDGDLPSLVLGPSSLTQTPRRPDLHDLDALPFPAWELVDIPRYRSIWLERHGYFSMNMVTTRGCPFHCNWCAKPIWGQRYNTRSPENVAAELRWLKENYHPDHIWFADDIFGLKPGWLARFGDLVAAQGGLPFKCLSRADLLTRPGEVEALQRAGAQTLWMGAESGSQMILDAMDKGTRVEQIHEAARRLKAAGIQVGFFLQFGYPGETRAEIEKTLQLVRDCSPDDIGVSVSYPMPGTQFFAAVREQLGEKQNWQASDDLAMLYQGPFSTAFYRQLHSVVHKEFRARKAWKRLRTRFGLRWAARLIYNLLTLPLARWQLNRLAAQAPGPALPLPHLPPEQAARPTPQEEA